MVRAMFDDQFSDHPKIVRLGPLATHLHMQAIIYACRYTTDGFVPAAKVRTLVDWGADGVVFADGSAPDNLALAARMVAANVWEEADGGYRIHDFLDHQYSAEEVRAYRANVSKARSEAGRRSGEARRAKAALRSGGAANTSNKTNKNPVCSEGSTESDEPRTVVHTEEAAVARASVLPASFVRATTPEESTTYETEDGFVRTNREQTTNKPRTNDERKRTQVQVLERVNNNNSAGVREQGSVNPESDGPTIAPEPEGDPEGETPVERIVAELRRVRALRTPPASTAAESNARRWASTAEHQSAGQYEIWRHVRFAIGQLENKFVDAPDMTPGQILGYLRTTTLGAWSKSKSSTPDEVLEYDDFDDDAPPRRSRRRVAGSDVNAPYPVVIGPPVLEW